MIDKLPFSLNKVSFSYFIIAILGAAIPFSLNLDKIAVILAALTTFIYLFTAKQQNIVKASLAVFFPPVAYILLLVIGITYSTDKSLAWQKVESSLPLLILPAFAFLVASKKISGLQADKLLLFFCISCFLSFVYAYAAVFFKTQIDVNDFDNFYIIFNRDDLADQIKIHPIYLSLINCINIQVLMYFLVQSRSGFNSLLSRSILVVLIICSFTFIVFLGAKMALIASMVSFILWFTVLILTKRKYITGILSIIFLFALVGISIIYVPNIQKRFTEIQDTELAPPQGLSHNSTNLRIGQLYCSLAVIKENTLLGTGTGDYTLALNSCYEMNAYSDVLYLDGYNSHNQYLQSWLMIGALGFTSLILMLFIPLRYAIRAKDWLIASFMIVLAFSFLTESVLQTTKGIMVFSFCYLIFIIRYFHSREAKDLSKNT